MIGRVSITSARFKNYKAFREFQVTLSSTNILVGPNNNGKSTIIGAFRILAQALRLARSRSPEVIWGPQTQRHGWRVPNDHIPVSSENIHTDYDLVDTTVDFRLSNGTTLTLFFPDDGGCKFFADSKAGFIRSSAELRKHAPVVLAVVPVLGPLEHEEPIVSEETVRKNLLTTRASRHFRNYWYYYPDGFETFAELVGRTWPGMEIERPERNDRALDMFCRENRMTRELFWSGFGFQIWLQLLAHISRSQDASILIVDEPELYLHPDVQLQLLTILREAGPDVLVATHSTEIMSEADPSEILLVDKAKKSAERLRDVEGVQRALTAVGSIQNITLTRLARNRRIVFTEGSTDFRLLRRFAQKMSLTELASGSDLTAMESGGFAAWDRVKGMAAAFGEALGFDLKVGAIFDRDYWCEENIQEIQAELDRHLSFAHIHSRKEIENYLLLPDLLDRATASAIREREVRSGQPVEQTVYSSEILNTICARLKSSIQSQYIAKRLDYFGKSRRDPASVTKDAVDLFDERWSTPEGRMQIVPGKEVLRAYREEVTRLYQVNVTDNRILSAMHVDEVPSDLVHLLERLEAFRVNS